MADDGRFITFEGPEGAGKTTVVKAVHQRLVAAGVDVVCTREPGGTRIGDQIRDVLLSRHNVDMAPETEFLLFSASRAQHVHEVIRPALDRGSIVLCDRFFDSSFAYQGYGRGLDLDALRTITKFATDDLVPDLTVLLDVEPAVGLARRRAAKGGGAEWNRIDNDEVMLHKQVRQGYLALAEREPARWRLVDASEIRQRVIEHVWKIVIEFIEG